MNLKTLLDSDVQELAEYLALMKKTYMIPFSQRPYEWEREQVERLFEDYTSVAENEDSFHIMNTVVFSGGSGDEKNIYDGQQRTITSALFVAAGMDVFRNVYLAHPDFIENATQSDIEDGEEWLTTMWKDYFENSQKFSKKEIIRKLVFTNDANTDFFYKLTNPKIDVTEDSVPANVDAENMFANYFVLRDLWIQYIEENDGQSIIPEIIQNALDKVVIIVLTTPTEKVAREMFESLNNTGKALTDLYVLKNDLAQKLSEDAMKNDWDLIEGNLKGLSNKVFLDTIASIITGKKTTKNALDIYTEKFPIEGAGDAKKALQQLVKYSYAFKNTHEPTAVSATDPASREYMIEAEINRVLGLRQHYPMIMSMFTEGYSLQEITRVLLVVQELFIKNLKIGGNRSNTLTVILTELSKEIMDTHISVDQIILNLQNKMIPDIEFKNKLISARFMQTSTINVVKLMFMRLANEELRDTEVDVPTDFSKLHYEHILPQNPRKDSDWEKNFENIAERVDLTTQLGNATLLLDVKNQRLGNKSFEEKKEQYRESAIPATKRLTSVEEWTKQEIEQRTEHLANAIVEYYAH